MKNLTLITTSIALAATALSVPAAAESEQSATFHAEDGAMCFMAVMSDGNFYLGRGEFKQFMTNSGRTLTIACAGELLFSTAEITEAVNAENTCSFEVDGETLEGARKYTFTPSGKAKSTCTLNRKDSIGFVEFPD